MKKHLHVLALLLVAVMLVSALAGCGGSGSSTPASGVWLYLGGRACRR